MRTKVPHEPAGAHIQAANTVIAEARAAYWRMEQRRRRWEEAKRDAAFCGILLGCVAVYYLAYWWLS